MPAPVGGWNARDAIASMDPTDAVELVNIFPRPSYVELRKGSSAHYLLQSGIFKTLAVYREQDGDETLFGFSNTGVFDVSFGGVSGGFILTPRTNGKHQWENFGDGTNNWLIAVNGVDKPFYWNGVTYTLVDDVTSPAITGITSTDIVSLGVFKKRLIFIRNNKLGFDYLPSGVVGGAATYFDLSSIATQGGYLMAIAVWTRDAGNGPDDYCVFITSQGEAIVYQGTDPSSANTWALVGTFRIGKPLGRRCVTKYGADPIILTETGAFPLSALLSSGDERQKFALSFKIQSAFSEAANVAFDQFGWKIQSFPEQDMLLINVPKREDGPHDQYVMNTISKAWCRFTGWDAEDFAVFDRNLYYCKGKTVYQAWEGTEDEVQRRGVVIVNGKFVPSGKPITFLSRGAFNDFGSAQTKHPVLFMPLIDSTRDLNYEASVSTDFVNQESTGAVTYQPSTIGKWDVSKWDAFKWGSADTISRQWGGSACWPGRWLAGNVKIVSSSASGKWMGSIMRFLVGESL